MKRLFIALALLSALPALPALADIHHLLPTPRQITAIEGVSEPIRSVMLSTPAYEEAWIEWLDEQGIPVTDDAPVAITATLVDDIPGLTLPDDARRDEAYRLTVRPSSIEVEAITPTGIYWALQTLRQLAEKDQLSRLPLQLPLCTIADYPAFPWRGILMDVGRSYLTMDELKREIELLSRFKVNVYHWHLTENQGFRLESTTFPALNDSIYTTRFPGHYYTLQEAQELDSFARAHAMMLLPEIDMPGHSAVFQRATGHDMQSAEGMEILKPIVAEACATFSAPYFHIGTDEVEFTNPDFVPEMVAFVRDKGKKVISWNPGWHYAPGEIDMIQMWSYRGRPIAKAPAFDSRLHYINHFDVFADIVALYRSNISGATEANDSIIGMEIGVWNDRLLADDIIADQEAIVGQNSLYPSMLALAERAWMGGGTEYFDVYGTNLRPDLEEDFAAFADFERRMMHHKDNTLRDVPFPYVEQTGVNWLITDAFPNEGELDRVFPPETEGIKAEYVYNDSTYSTTPATGAGIYLRHVWGPGTVKTFYPNPQPNHTAYAFTQVYSPVEQTVGLQFETQNYSRSEKDIPPRQGTWDYRSSRLWINGEEIQPPVWTATHTEHSNEIAMGNENFAAREPLPITLHEGWNTVMIKLPIGKFSAPETRIAKWMFTCVFTTPDGRHAAPGLIYSPEGTK